jgi:TolB protein
LTGKVVSIEETKLRGEFLVNYKIGDDIRAAVAELNHEVWELTDETGRQWWIIKVCGNLASRLPQEALIATPVPRPLPPLAEVVVDGLVVRTCASEDCTEVGTVPRGSQVEVFGCLAKGGNWCEVGWSGGRGWCTGQSLRQLAVATVIPEAKPVPPTPTPTSTQEVVARGEGKIVFERPGAIYIINADGSGLIRLTDDGLTPAWSPDGQRIAFARNGDIYVINADGSDQTNLTSNPDFHFYLDPAWSPDGQQILFTSSGDPNYPAGRLLVINDDGSGLRDLIDPSLFPTLAVWSPDGTRIAFLGGGGIQVVDANGSNLTRLTDGGGGLDWSPDGQRIAFARNGDIYVINADGSGLTRLTNHPGEDTWPAWSPDNRQIVFRSTRDGDYYIYVMNADGSGLTRLTDGNNPDW